MKIDYIEPFVKAGIDVIATYLGHSLTRGPLSVRKTTFTTEDINIVAAVDGDVYGCAIYAMGIKTAINIAASMLGEEVEVMDELSWSAVTELGNIITGHATQLLYDAGLSCHMIPPTIMRGVNMEISTSVAALVVPLYTPHGVFEINVAVDEACSEASL